MNAAGVLLVVLAAAADAGDGAVSDAGAGDGTAADARVDGAEAGPRDAGASRTAAAPPPSPPPSPPPPPAPPPVLVPLRVRVLEKGTRRPLAGAAISIDAVPAGETGADGRFVTAVPPGAHHVQAQWVAHEDAGLRVEAAAPGGVELVLRLAPSDTGERYETTVRITRPELARVAVTGDEARRTAGTGGDPMRVIGSLPGVSQIVWPAALFVVRGANPGNTGFFLDGLRVPALFHLALGPSVIHPYLVAGVDFFPGSYPASYGGYASGIVAARTAPPPTDRVHAAADVTLYDAGGVVTAPWRRGAVAAAARYSYTGALFSALSSDSTLRYGDYQLRADHPAAGGQATLLAFGSLDELGWGYPPAVPMEYAALQFHRLDLRWRGPLGRGRLLAAVAVGADWARSTLFQRPIRVRALSATPRLAYERPVGASADLQLGADAELQDFATVVPAFQQRQSDLGRSRQASSQGLHATLRVRAGRRLTVAPGFRAQLFAEQSVRRLALQPRLDVLVQLAAPLALRASAGRFAQMPSLPVSVPGFEAFGLADLGLQTSTGGALGVDARLPRGFTATATGYYQEVRLTDVRNIDVNPTTVDPTAPDYLVSRRGRAYGGELLVRRADGGRLHGWLAYTLSWSLRFDDNGVLGPSDWDQRHMLNLVAGYRLGRGYSVGARFHYHTGRVAPIFGSGGQYRKLPDFYQVDLRADRRFVFDRFVLDVYIDIANATRTRQIIQLSDVGTLDAPEVQAQGFKLVLPTIGLHAEF